MLAAIASDGDELGIGCCAAVATNRPNACHARTEVPTRDTDFVPCVELRQSPVLSSLHATQNLLPRTPATYAFPSFGVRQVYHLGRLPKFRPGLLRTLGLVSRPLIDRFGTGNDSSIRLTTVGFPLLIELPEDFLRNLLGAEHHRPRVSVTCLAGSGVDVWRRKARSIWHGLEGLLLPISLLAGLLVLLVPLPGPLMDFFVGSKYHGFRVDSVGNDPNSHADGVLRLSDGTVGDHAFPVGDEHRHDATHFDAGTDPRYGLDAAGFVVRQFGQFVAADQLVVGIVIFWHYPCRAVHCDYAWHKPGERGGCSVYA